MCTSLPSVRPTVTPLSCISGRSDVASNQSFVPNLWKTILVAGLLEFGIEDKGVWTISSPVPSALLRGLGMNTLTGLFLHLLLWPGWGLTRAPPEEPWTPLLIPGFSGESGLLGNTVRNYTLYSPCRVGEQKVIKEIQTQKREESEYFFIWKTYLHYLALSPSSLGS